MPVVYPEPEEPIEIARRITGELRGAQGLLPSWDVPELQEIGDLIEADLRAAIASVDSLIDLLGGRGDAPPEGADWFAHFAHTMKAANARAEREIAQLEALRLRITGGRASETAPVAAPTRTTRGRRSTKGQLGATVQAEDGIVRRQLTERQRELVRGLRVDGQRVYGPTDKIDDWPALKIVVETLGGSWRSGGGKRQGFWTFDDGADVEETLRLALERGEVLDPKANDYFFTPEPLAAEIVRLADVRPGMRVLEPHAGEGHLVRALLATLQSPKDVDIMCVELLPAHRDALRALGLTVAETPDFMRVDSDEVGLFERVLMNPPFTGYITHIGRALQLLKPGGRIVSVAPASVRFRQDEKTATLRALIERFGGQIIDNPEGSFAVAGTWIRTCTIVVQT